MSDEIEFWVTGEWTMVYLNGELQRAGDHYLAAEWLEEHYGVTVVQDEAGVSVPDGHNALRTLAEVHAASKAHSERMAEAQRKRDEATRLLSEAMALEDGQ
jgi:hypothetical protein